MLKKPCFWENCLFTSKKDIYLNTKVVPNCRYCKANKKKYFFQIKYFWVVLGVLKYGVFGVFCYFWDHTNAIKTKKSFLKVFETTLFLGKYHFLTPERQFLEHFLAIFI